MHDLPGEVVRRPGQQPVHALSHLLRFVDPLEWNHAHRSLSNRVGAEDGGSESGFGQAGGDDVDTKAASRIGGGGRTNHGFNAAFGCGDGLVIGESVTARYARSEDHASGTGLEHRFSCGFERDEGGHEVGLNDGFKILNFGGVRWAQRNRTHQVGHAGQALFAQTGCVGNSGLNDGFVKGVALDEMGASVNEFVDAFSVSGQESDLMVVVQQQGGEMAGNVAASANQKKRFAHGIITLQDPFILLFWE